MCLILQIYLFQAHRFFSFTFIVLIRIEIIERLKNTNIKIQEIYKLLPSILQYYVMVPSIGNSYEEDL